MISPWGGFPNRFIQRGPNYLLAVILLSFTQHLPTAKQTSDHIQPEDAAMMKRPKGTQKRGNRSKSVAPLLSFSAPCTSRAGLLPHRLRLAAVFIGDLIQRVGKVQLALAVGIEVALRIFSFSCARWLGLFLTCPGGLLWRRLRLFLLLLYNRFNRIRCGLLLVEGQVDQAAAKIPVEIADRSMSRMDRGNLYHKLVDDEHHDKEKEGPEDWFDQTMHKSSVRMMVGVVAV